MIRKTINLNSFQVKIRQVEYEKKNQLLGVDDLEVNMEFFHGFFLLGFKTELEGSTEYITINKSLNFKDMIHAFILFIGFRAIYRPVRLISNGPYPGCIKYWQ